MHRKRESIERIRAKGSQKVKRKRLLVYNFGRNSKRNVKNWAGAFDFMIEIIQYRIMTLVTLKHRAVAL